MPEPKLSSQAKKVALRIRDLPVEDRSEDISGARTVRKASGPMSVGVRGVVHPSVRLIYLGPSPARALSSAPLPLSSQLSREAAIEKSLQVGKLLWIWT
jgi:hypothetical protein